MLASGASWRYGVWDRRERTLHRDFAFQAEHADEEGTLDAVRVALDAGGDVNAVDETGSTALHYVADKGFPRVVKLLVEHGAGGECGELPRPNTAGGRHARARQHRGRPGDRGPAARAGAPRNPPAGRVRWTATTW